MKTIGVHHEQCKFVNLIVANFMMGGKNEIHRDICLKEKIEAYEKDLGLDYSILRELAEYRNSLLLQRLLRIRLWTRKVGLTSFIRKIINHRL